MHKGMNVLRAVESRDYEALEELRGDVQLQNILMANPDPYLQNDMSSWVTRRGNNGSFNVIQSNQGHCIGFTQINNIHQINKYGWLGIALSKQARGCGYGRRAMREMHFKAQVEFGLRKLLLEVRCDNQVALKLYQSMGYREVGTLLQHYDDGERIHDVILMEKYLGE